MADLDATSHGGDEVARELRALATQIVSLQADVRRLESAPLPRESESGWAGSAPLPPATFGWISSLETPTPRRAPVRIPRLPLELAFLAAAAVLAGLAHLCPLVIAAVMGGAFAIVALAEWAGSRGDRLRQRLLLETPVHISQPQPDAVQADPTWFTPPVEHTLIARASSPEEPEAQTTVSELPPPEAETTAERSAG